jgi:L-rhamnose mutarotase
MILKMAKFQKNTRNPIIRSLEGGMHKWPIFTGKSTTELYSYREFEIFKQTLTSQNIQECTTKQWNAFMREGRNLMKAKNFTLNAVANARKSIFLENTKNNNKDTS